MFCKSREVLHWAVVNFNLGSFVSYILGPLFPKLILHEQNLAFSSQLLSQRYLSYGLVPKKCFGLFKIVCVLVKLSFIVLVLIVMAQSYP